MPNISLKKVKASLSISELRFFSTVEEDVSALLDSK